jgi:hypothetical protein
MKWGRGGEIKVSGARWLGSGESVSSWRVRRCFVSLSAVHCLAFKPCGGGTLRSAQSDMEVNLDNLPIIQYN